MLLALPGMLEYNSADVYKSAFLVRPGTLGTKSASLVGLWSITNGFYITH